MNVIVGRANRVLFAMALALVSAYNCGDDAISNSVAVILPSPDKLDFGEREPFTAHDLSLQIVNEGRRPLLILGVEIRNDVRSAFAVRDRPAEVPGGSSATLVVTYTVPEEEGEDTATLLIMSQADNAPALSVPLLGRARRVNKLPSVRVRFANDEPRTLDDLEAVVEGSDPDGDEVTFAYSWTRNGQLTQQREEVVAASETKKGDLWSVTVVPHDGTDRGDPASASATVLNTPPHLASVGLSPSVPTAAVLIMATPEGGSDDDGDDLQFLFEWTVAGNVVEGATGPTLAQSAFARGQEVTIKVTPYDGEDRGAPVTASVVVGNAPPRVTLVSVSPASGGRGTTFTCVPAGWSDPDGDGENYTFYWTVEGQPGGTGAVLPPGSAHKGQSLTCTATPTDGLVAGMPITSDAIVLGNTPPVIASVTLAPVGGGEPMRGKAILATPSGVSDEDPEDAVAVKYEWHIGSRVSLIESATLPGSEFVKGDQIAVTAQADDGTALSSAVTSNTLVVQNSPPKAPAVTIEPESPEDTEDIMCSVSTLSIDGDGDAIAYSFSWTRNGEPFAGAISPNDLESMVSAASTGLGDVFSCTASGTDGVAAGPASGPAVATVVNSLCSEASSACEGCVATSATEYTCTDCLNNSSTGLHCTACPGWREDSSGACVNICGGMSGSCSVLPVCNNPGLPAYTVTNVNGEVVIGNTVTGLLWQSNYSQSPPLGFGWADANAYCVGLSYGGIQGWRLPTRDELREIHNLFGSDVNRCGFVWGGGKFWSSTEYHLSLRHAYSINFGGDGSPAWSWGYEYTSDKFNDLLRARCVR